MSSSRSRLVDASVSSCSEIASSSGAEPDAAAGSESDTSLSWVPVRFHSRSPGSRVFPSAVVHGDSLYIFGGHDGVVYRNDLLVFNLETRTWMLDLEVDGEGPSPRDAHAAVLHGSRMYIFGGYDSKRYLNDYHAFHFGASAWSEVDFNGVAPSPRGGHTAVVYNDEALIFGGCDGWNYFNDLYRFSFIPAEWHPVRVTGTAPGARSAPTAVIHPGHAAMYVFGGYDGGRSLNDLFRFDLARAEWSAVRVAGTPPSPRGGHTAVVHEQVMYAFGGKSGRSPFNDLHAFSFERGTWEAVSASRTAPAPRCAHTCVVHASSLFVFGGYDGRRYFEDCFELTLADSSASSVLSLSGDLESMVNNKQFSDVSFVVAGSTVYAHKFILFARSDYFRRMFTSGYRESSESSIPIPDVSLDVFLCVLSFLYTGKPKDIAPEMALEVMGIANLYSIDPLKRMCADLVTRSLGVENVAYVLQAADTYGVPQLRAACIGFMASHFGEVVRTDAFRELISKENRGIIIEFLEEAAGRFDMGRLHLDDAPGERDNASTLNALLN